MITRPQLLIGKSDELDRFVLEEDKSVAISINKKLLPVSPTAFIVGVGRSGTTLLRRILMEHPNVAMPGESHFVSLLREAIRLVNLGYKPRVVAKALMEISDSLTSWGLPPLDAQALLQEALGMREPSERKILMLLYGRLSMNWCRTKVVDKTSSLGLRAAELASWWPNAKFIHLVRDGRNVAESHTRLGWYSTASAALTNWVCRENKINRQLSLIDPSRQLNVRYEDLVENPDKVCAQIFDFLKLEFDAKFISGTSSLYTHIDTIQNMDVHPHLFDPIEKSASLTQGGPRSRPNRLSPSDATLLKRYG